MRLLRLRVMDFAAIVKAEVDFGKGLNVLYGPNDLGKSTLAESIRSVLLLPHSSTFSEQYIPWRGGHQPIVEMTFETEAQRIWRVKKQFGKSGSSLLQESRNGIDFDDIAKGRSVDGKLREILRWGIPEPGGTGSGRGIPTSFLATALLSTQADVTAVLQESLQGDSAPSGKERIAAALQAVAQDPLFVSLLRATQARRDEAFTDKGMKKTARDSPFRMASERLKEIRDEKERLQALVDESESVEELLRELTDRRNVAEESLAVAGQRQVESERLATQAAELAGAAEDVRLARDEVARIQTLGSDVAGAEQSAADLAAKKEQAEQAVKNAQHRKVEADAALQAAQDAVVSASGDTATSATVARQRLELRRAAAEKAFSEAQQRKEAVQAAQKLVESAASADRTHSTQESEVQRTRASVAAAIEQQQRVEQQLRTLDVLERALEARGADQQVAIAQAAVDKATALRTRFDSVAAERDGLQARRESLKVPTAETLTGMRRLATDLAKARGALDVGLLVTITPHRPLDIRVQKDNAPSESESGEQVVEIEAKTHVELDLADVATVRVTGGRRDAQRTAQALNERWREEVMPHLAAASATDLDELDAKVREATELDSSIQAKEAARRSLKEQLESLSGSDDALRAASDRQRTGHAALGMPLDTLTDDLHRLGRDPSATLRKQRDQARGALEAARRADSEEGTAHTLAEERSRSSRATLEAAISARDEALQSFPEGLPIAFADVQAALGLATEEQQRVTRELASLDSSIAAEQARIDGALSDARKKADVARSQVEAAQEQLTNAITKHASETGRLNELRRLRDAEDLVAAENRLRTASERHGTMPVPERLVSDADITAAREAVVRANSHLDMIEREIQKAHGALEQVGGAVARERLRDVIEAYELAERHEREIEADYEAWKLLLEQMKDADAAQASNLGQALAPAIANRFEALTARRYENVRLTAQLGTEGVVAGGAVRPAECLSVGTREQLSTLYRLSLAEYLGTTVVLDDQLVQSDEKRMDWFRALLVDKARNFQIVVFTCRPEDYLSQAAMVAPGTSPNRDTDDGFVRSIDLSGAVQRR
jgi:DNA repair exonuclease SbcCD ATPase subunit